VLDEVNAAEVVTSEIETEVTPAAGQETVPTEAKEVKIYTLDNGQECSRSAFIRQEFMKDRSRGDIAKEVGIAYGLVYTATANMYNLVHPEGGTGRTGNRGAILDAEVTLKDGTVIPIGSSRADLFRAQVTSGEKTRGELAKEFDIPYATVYAATKDAVVPGGEATHGGRVILENGTPRAEYIRAQFAAGITRRAIADELHCDYAIVWAATKGKKEAGEAVEGANAAPEDATPPDVSSEETVKMVETVEEVVSTPASDTNFGVEDNSDY